MESKSRKDSPKERSTAAENVPPTTRKPSTRVKGAINYDEKHAFKDLKESLDHAVDDRAPSDPEEQGSDHEDSWETDSFLEEALIELTEDDFVDGKSFTFLVSMHLFRSLLQQILLFHLCRCATLPIPDRTIRQ